VKSAARTSPLLLLLLALASLPRSSADRASGMPEPRIAEYFLLELGAISILH